MLEFHTTNFPIEPGEDEQTNPGIFGRSLAAWFGQELVPGFTPDQVLAEDFGWLAEVPHPKCTLYIGCQMTDETPSDCLVQIIALGGWKGRLMLSDPRPQAESDLFARVKARLEREPGVNGLKVE